MKKKIYIFGLLLVSGFYFAQSGTENYIASRILLEPVTDSTLLSSAKQIRTVQYFDGLGRPKQVVNVKASPAQKDVAVHFEYDQFGRQTKDYLPVPQSGTQNGTIYTAPLSNASSVYGAEKIYAEKLLESSPLDRILQQKQVGNDWDNHPVQFGYNSNNAAEVKKYMASFNYTTCEATINLSGTFGDNQLYKNTVTDEDGNISIEFKNGQGQTLLVRKHDGSQNVDTYYVYNEYDQLAFVITPLASVAPALDQTTLDNLCYQYKYDGRNRLVEKKLPGKGWEWMVYDQQDRLVATKDAQNQWLFTKYDMFGRVVYTGLANLGTSRQTVQQALNSLTGAAALNNETRQTGGFSNSSMQVYYTNTAYPAAISKVLSVNYYDTYPAGTPTVPATVLTQAVLPQDAQANSISTKSLPTASYVKNIEDDLWTMTYTWYDMKGRAIGSHSINHLGGYTKTESELDFAGIVQKNNTYHKRKTNNPEVVIRERYVYTPQNLLLKHYHQVDSHAEELLTENHYNEKGELDNKKVGNNLQSIDYTYNIRGWMTGINAEALNSVNGSGKLFAYDIRYTNPTDNSLSPPKFNGNIAEVNWVFSNNGIVKRYAYRYDSLNRLEDATFLHPHASIPLNHLNDEKLTYDLNGNIQTLQRNAAAHFSTTPDLIDNLEYSYNGNRLLSISDQSQNPTGYEGGGNPLRYDANGNMTEMRDKNIDNIGYNFLNLPNTVAIEGNRKIMFYTYRADGTKLRKLFNYMNEDESMSAAITEYIDGFHYLTTQGTAPNQADPADFAYEQEAFIRTVLSIRPTPSLQFFPTAEGFYDYENKQYIYQYKDHLGNVRISYKNTNGTPQYLDQNDYYPFGMNIPRDKKSVFGTGSYTNYKYNGKELQETGMYDYGARFYMPDIGRWGVVDPLGEKHPDLNPMMYASNNPIIFIDPDGMDWVEDKKGDITWRDDVTAKNYKDKGVLQKGETYRGTYYERTNNWNNSKAKGLVLETYHTYGKMSFAKQIGLEINVTGEASAIGRKDRMGRDAFFAQGTMQTIALFDNGRSAVLQTVDVNSGPWDYGPTPNREYLASGIEDTNESGMVRDGVGFKVFLNDNTELNRTQLRIHPDEIPYLGTAGCIGICGNSRELKDFRNVVRNYFNKSTVPFKVNVNFRSNPNYRRPKQGIANSGQ